MQLRPYQKDAVDAVFKEWEQKNSTLLILPTGCHALGEKLLMADETVKKVEDINMHDLLMGIDKTPREVLYIHKGVDDMYKIMSSDGSNFNVTGEHKLTVIQSDLHLDNATLNLNQNDLQDIEVRELVNKQCIGKLNYYLVKITEARNNYIRVYLTKFSIKPIGRAAYIGFTVDKDNRYLLSNKIITHNCGKTVIFSQIVKELNDANKKVLILAHRGELLEQTQDKLSKFGILSVLEKAEFHADIENDNIIVASIQSISRDNRLLNYPKDYFDAIIIDEAHHAVSDTYMKVINYFSTAKLLGVTATPNRSDVRSVSDIFESVAYTYNIRDAIDEHWLSPICIQRIPIEIDLSEVRVSCGDYVPSDLENVLHPYLVEIANKLKDIAADRKTLIFTPTIAIGEEFTEILNNAGFRAACVSGKSKDRDEIKQKLHNGELNVVCNSMLWVEGFDEPSVDCIINLRATKSTSLYTQIIGRGLRLSPQTAKENLLVLDFLWHSGRKGYDILSPVNLFIDSNKASYAEKILNKCECEDLFELEKQADAAKLLAENLKNASKKFFMGIEIKELKNPNLSYSYNYSQLDSVSIMNDEAVKFYTGKDVFKWYPYHKWEIEPLTSKQAEMLSSNGFDLKKIPYKGMASKLIDTVFKHKETNRCSFKQYKFLTKRGFRNVDKWSKSDAAKMMDIISKNNWRLPYKIKTSTYIPDSLRTLSQKSH